MIIVAQNPRLTYEVADYVYLMTKGKVVYGSTPAELRDSNGIRSKYLGV